MFTFFFYSKVDKYGFGRENCTNSKFMAVSLQTVARDSQHKKSLLRVNTYLMKLCWYPECVIRYSPTAEVIYMPMINSRCSYPRSVCKLFGSKRASVMNVMLNN